MTKMSAKSNCRLVFYTFLLFALLYCFICSLYLMTSSFHLLSSKEKCKIFDDHYLENPILAVMVGILSTSLVQSSSTITSIVVALVASQTITVGQGIPVIMGANIGTSLTSTLVSISHVKHKVEYQRAFSAAVLHSLFNGLSVIVMLSIEVTTNFLERTTKLIVNSFNINQNTTHGPKTQFLNVIIKPLTDSIILLDDNKKYLLDCEDESAGEGLEGFNDTQFFTHVNTTQLFTRHIVTILKTDCDGNCGYLFANSGLSDVVIGVIILIISLIILFASLIFIAKILNILLAHNLAILLKKTVNSDIEGYPWLTGYIAILVGGGITFLVQSSSIFTSALVPLVASEFITLERAYPLILGANVGTTGTGILAALSAASGTHTALSLQLALCHLFFNICGILLFYPIPSMRWPVFIANKFGQKVIKYRWFSIFYLLVLFLLLPLGVFAISLGGFTFMYIVLVPVVILTVLVILINIIQNNKQDLLPPVLRDWGFLPKELRTFQTVDYVVQTYMEVFCCCIVSRTMAVLPTLRDVHGQGGLLGSKVSQEMQLVDLKKQMASSVSTILEGYDNKGYKKDDCASSITEV